MSFKVEVHGVGDPKGHFVSNGLRFATQTEAMASGNELSGRWLGMDEYRVAESEDAVNYRFEGGRNVRLGEVNG